MNKYKKDGFVLRQLGYLSKHENFNPEAALEAIEAKVPHHLKSEVTQVRAILNGNHREGHGVLAEFGRLVQPSVENLSAYLLAFEESKRDMYQGFRVLLAGQKNFIHYSLALYVIALLVFSIYTLNVLPSLQQVYQDVGVDVLPEFTLFFLNNGVMVLIGVFSIMAAMLLGLFISKKFVLTSVCEFKPLKNSLFSAYLFGSVGEYNDYLLASYVKLLLVAGEEEAVVIEKAKALFRKFVDDDIELPETIKLSSSLGTLRDDIDYQLTDLSQALLESASQHRLRIQQVYFAMSGILVGSLVISMYLPIFAIGGAV